jgi:hypothetical protein
MCEFDLDYDGNRETRNDYDRGVLREVDVRDPKTQKLVLVKQFTHGRLATSRIDSDGDGVIDTLRRHDVAGEIVGQERIAGTLSK